MRSVIFLFLVSINFIGFSQNDFNAAMHKNIVLLDSARTAEQYVTAANAFSRIAQAEKDLWLPYYYAAFARINAAMQTDKKNSMDDLLDMAQSDLSKADSLKSNNSEIYALQAMLYSGRIMVNPVVRGKKYGSQSNEYIQKAIDADPSNPRSYYLKGNNLFYTPPQFGGSREGACEMYHLAWEKMKTFTPAAENYPVWGKDEIAEMLTNCAVEGGK